MKVAYPWFGGKSRIASTVWEYFGDVTNYVEPFFGGGAVLLQRPDWHKKHSEIINDIDGYISNFWRAVKHDPAGVAQYADYGINEIDLHSRHKWLITHIDLVDKLDADPDYYDIKIAGWWVWGISCWMGQGWCNSTTPAKSIPSYRRRGVHRITDRSDIFGMMQRLSDRMRNAIVTCGDWKRVLTRPFTIGEGATAGVFLDPPYATTDRTMIYCNNDSVSIAHECKVWALEHGDKMKVALCGYESDTYQMPGDWVEVPWKAVGGYGNQGKGQGRKNCHKERVWFSPLCERKDLV